MVARDKTPRMAQGAQRKAALKDRTSRRTALQKRFCKNIRKTPKVQAFEACMRRHVLLNVALTTGITTKATNEDTKRKKQRTFSNKSWRKKSI